MEVKVKYKELGKINGEIQNSRAVSLKVCTTIDDVVNELYCQDSSYNAIVKSLRKTEARLTSEAAAIGGMGSALTQIAGLYHSTEMQICCRDAIRRIKNIPGGSGKNDMFGNIPDDKKIKLEGWTKKLVIEDTDHTVELVDPRYFDENIKDNVDEISKESVARDMLDALLKTMKNDPGADEAQTRFTLNSQILAENKLIGLLLTYAEEAYGLEEGDLDDLNISTEYLAYGILIDGEPMIEYAMEHPEEFYDDTTPLAQRDRNRARSAARK